ncbi:MAG: hypothetical protein ACKV2V_14375, partial [Blastocatellia bacterium]
MSIPNKHRLDLFRRVLAFGAAHQQDFQADSPCHSLLNRISETLDSLESDGITLTAQRNHARQSTVVKKTAREELWNAMRDVHRAARAMSATIPALKDRFAMPGKRDEQTLLRTAGVFVAEAEPLLAEFIRYEAPAGFLDRLRALIGAVSQEAARRDATLTGGRKASTSMKDALGGGMEAVRQLNDIMRVKYADDSSTLDEW